MCRGGTYPVLISVIADVADIAEVSLVLHKDLVGVGEPVAEDVHFGLNAERNSCVSFDAHVQVFYL